MICVPLVLTGVSLTAQETDRQAAPKTTPEVISEMAPANSDAVHINSAGNDDTGKGTHEIDQGLWRDQLSVVADNTLTIAARELPAYWTLVDHIVSHQFEDLSARARRDVPLRGIFEDPQRHRGELIFVRLNVRQVIPYEVTPSDGRQVGRLYELWGWTSETKAYMYCLVTPELPVGLPASGRTVSTVDCAGYFFKMQAYFPGKGTSGSPLVAPLLIGRGRVVPTPAPASPSLSGQWVWMLAGIGLLLLVRRSLIWLKPAPAYRRRTRRVVHLDRDAGPLEATRPDQVERRLPDSDWQPPEADFTPDAGSRVGEND